MTVLAAIGTLASGGNYMFLRHPPRQDSLLDLMGPWPWYIPAAAALALALFWLLDRPFDGRRARRLRGLGLSRCPTTPPRSPSGSTATRRTPCGRARSCASARSAGPARR